MKAVLFSCDSIQCVTEFTFRILIGLQAVKTIQLFMMKIFSFILLYIYNVKKFTISVAMLIRENTSTVIGLTGGYFNGT